MPSQYKWALAILGLTGLIWLACSGNSTGPTKNSNSDEQELLYTYGSIDGEFWLSVTDLANDSLLSASPAPFLVNSMVFNASCSKLMLPSSLENVTYVISTDSLDTDTTLEYFQYLFIDAERNIGIGLNRSTIMTFDATTLQKLGSSSTPTKKSVDIDTHAGVLLLLLTDSISVYDYINREFVGSLVPKQEDGTRVEIDRAVPIPGHDRILLCDNSTVYLYSPSSDSLVIAMELANLNGLSLVYTLDERRNRLYFTSPANIFWPGPVLDPNPVFVLDLQTDTIAASFPAEKDIWDIALGSNGILYACGRLALTPVYWYDTESGEIVDETHTVVSGHVLVPREFEIVRRQTP